MTPKKQSVFAKSRPLFCVAVLLSGLASIAGCHITVPNPGIKGSGILKTEAREAEGFSKIDISNVVHLDWKPGSEHSVEVTVEDNLLPHLVTQVKGETLTVYFDENVDPTKDVMVKVTSPNLEALTASGATHSNLKNLDSDRFTLSLSGASRCTITGKAAELVVDCSGASHLRGEELSAAVGTVAANGAATGHVKVRAPESVQCSGASNIRVSAVDAEGLTVDLSGGSRCTVAGKVKKLTINGDGAAALHAADLDAESIHVDLNGAARAELGPAEILTGRASGAASVQYQGEPSQSVKTSGVASVRRK
jgi:hypothetical protein